MNNGNYGVINERKCMEIEKRDTGIQGVCPKRIFTENDAQTIKNIWKGKKMIKNFNCNNTKYYSFLFIGIQCPYVIYMHVFELMFK